MYLDVSSRGFVKAAAPIAAYVARQFADSLIVPARFLFSELAELFYSMYSISNLFLTINLLLSIRRRANPSALDSSFRLAISCNIVTQYCDNIAVISHLVHFSPISRNVLRM